MKPAWPFIKPVDTKRLNIPDYHTIIERPMDLNTIDKRLKSTYYTGSTECLHVSYITVLNFFFCYLG